MESTGDRIEEGSELFSLKGLSTVEDLARVTDAPAPGVEDLRFVEKESDVEEDEDAAAIDSDEEEDQRRLELLQEEYLEESYNRFMAEKVSAAICSYSLFWITWKFHAPLIYIRTVIKGTYKWFN